MSKIRDLMRDHIIAQAESDIGEIIARVTRKTGETVIVIYITAHGEPPTIKLLMARP